MRLHVVIQTSERTFGFNQNEILSFSCLPFVGSSAEASSVMSERGIESWSENCPALHASHDERKTILETKLLLTFNTCASLLFPIPGGFLCSWLTQTTTMGSKKRFRFVLANWKCDTNYSWCQRKHERMEQANLIFALHAANADPSRASWRKISENSSPKTKNFSQTWLWAFYNFTRS